MQLKLYYSTQHQPADTPANAGLGAALDRLPQLRDLDISCQKIDTADLSDGAVYQAYAAAWAPAISKKFGIRRVFGTRRRSGCYFGREVPALLVYEDDGEEPSDVYPREELGRTVTIAEFLKDLVVNEQLT